MEKYTYIRKTVTWQNRRCRRPATSWGSSPKGCAGPLACVALGQAVQFA